MSAVVVVFLEYEPGSYAAAALLVHRPQGGEPSILVKKPSLSNRGGVAKRPVLQPGVGA
jgi:hypothetical protein